MTKARSLVKNLPSNGEVTGFLREFDDSMEVAIEASPSWC